MILKPLLPAILLALVMSVFVGVLATGRGSGVTLGLAAALYILQVGFAIVRINAPFWNAGATGVEDDRAVACVWSNAVLAALVYAWGATAMFAIYSLSGLYWRHWWEYGALMSIIAGGILLYVYLLGSGRTTLHTRALQVLIGPDGAAGRRHERGIRLPADVGEIADAARRLGRELHLHRPARSSSSCSPSSPS